jgi:hypothetical protein
MAWYKLDSSGSGQKQWRALTKTVIQFRFPQDVGKFLSS